MDTKTNTYTLLDDGAELYKQMLQSIKRAKHYVYLETYILSSDEVGREFQEVLIKKAEEGVKVVVIYDAIGSILTRESFFRKMAKGGVQVHCFNPVIFNSTRLTNLRGFHNRDHRKILVIDDTISFIGGQNISKRYVNYLRDCQIKIIGPLSFRLKESFLESLRIVKNDLYHKKRFLKPLLKRFYRDQRHERDKALRDIPSYKNQYIRNEYLRYIFHAKKKIIIANAYFIPDKKLTDALIGASRRGVDVQVIVPEKTDFRLVDYASYHTYQNLLEEGIELYWYYKKFIHAKFMVVDERLITIGSTNLDYRSMRHNYEVNVFIENTKLAKDFHSMFQVDLKESVKVEPTRWKERPFYQKALEQFAFYFRDLL